MSRWKTFVLMMSHFKGGKLLSKVFSQIGFEKAGGKIKCFLKPFQMFVELGPVDEGSSKLN